ncbi:hypothetical protein [Pannonibacter tanglangensis]|uniref:DUF2946 domain-containing protein n=1 Tax=Pannonibacter tanglangensis TaxID=2750084 RepID=A0ABW9ZFJ1_9HYPH|nr:hypothetical protein [Pannonibacter sp. XCT-34]NBN63620.1 hypothetical protein [Pannonibacter sp. XCT-34]
MQAWTNILARGLAALPVLMRIACALALVVLAYGHRPVAQTSAVIQSPQQVLRSAAGVDLSAYVLPDGSLPVLCHALAPDTHNQDKAAPGPACEACRLSASVALPSPPAGVVQPVTSPPRVLDVRVHAVPARSDPRQPGDPRAPPRHLLII